MPRQKIAILGGGISGLTAAYHLSRTPELRDKFEVTVYQMGWRLGGKIASGRDATGRNIEHGLHVWFGCYENAFKMLQDVYAARTSRAPFNSWTDAVKPQAFTPIGVQTEAGWEYWPISWPSNPGTPGQGGVGLTLWDMITTLVGMLRQIIDNFDVDFPLVNPPRESVVRRFVRKILASLNTIGLPIGTMARPLVDALAAVHAQSVLEVVKAPNLWDDALSIDSKKHAPAHPKAIIDLLHLLNESVTDGLTAGERVSTATKVASELLDIGKAFTKGLIEDIFIPDQPFAALDKGKLEFREWLVSHGADPAIVAESSIVRALYDTAFQYLDGDPTKPSYAAGTAVGVLVRLIATYKGDMLWDIQSGIGEAVISPIYEALLAADVKFCFFCKVRGLELSPDKSRIERIHFDRQAKIVAPPYRPTFNLGGLDCWGSEPDWSQLVDGSQLRKDGVDFESHWCTKAVNQETLQYGGNFHAVVLAIPLGAYKPLNAEPGMCDELIDNSRKFRDFVNQNPIVPTLSVQLWCDVTTTALGWNMQKPAAVAGPEPVSVWADMSQVLAFEPWQNGPAKPKSLQYLTGVFATELFREPSTNADVPRLADAAVRAEVVNWLERSSWAAWPAASDGKSFRWDMLTDPENRAGVERLHAQYVRVNIDPTECCVGSPAGSTRFRLGPVDHGFPNLFLAGEAARNGCNTSSVEGAVMSGMAAARAISGESLEIVGYDFLTKRPSQFLF